jgi:hypothetical protein
MAAGRPQKAHPGELWFFAEQFYWDFRKLAEGRLISQVDEAEYKRLFDKAYERHEIKVVKAVVGEIKRGRTRAENRDDRLTEEKDKLGMMRFFLSFRANDQARNQVRIPGKPEILAMLLKAKTAAQVKSICEDAFIPGTVERPDGAKREVMWPNWPISIGSVLPMYLSQFAAQFVTAKNGERYPRSDRPSSLLKQLWFLSRALSGALHGVEVRTATNLVGSKRPEQMFEESRAAKPSRRRAEKRNRRNRD